MIITIERNVAIPERPETKETGELIINTDNIVTFESRTAFQILDRLGSVKGEGIIIIINGIPYTIFLQNILEPDFEDNLNKYKEQVEKIITCLKQNGIKNV